MSLLDADMLKDTLLVTEYPVLTALTLSRSPSSALLNRLKSYLAGKDTKFAYLNKMYLVYSTLVKKYCSKNECSTSDLVNLKF